jgi:hypothetical protein
MIRIRSVAALLAALALTACDDDEGGIQKLTEVQPAARIKFFNFGLGAPGVNFYANDVKVTAIGSATGAEATTGTAQGGVGNGGLYSSLTPGQYTFTGRIAAATDKDLAVATLASTLEDGKAYSMYLSGPYNIAAKSVDAFIVEDPFVDEVDYSKAYVRLVNAIHNAPALSLFIKVPGAGNPELPIGDAVAYKSAGAFVAVTGGAYDLVLRRAGSTTPVVVREGVSISNKFVYTVGARGDLTVTSTTAANRPQLDFTANR